MCSSDLRRSIIAEMGEDIEEVFQEQAEDNALAESLDLEFPTDVQEKETPEMPETETETTPAKLTLPQGVEE